MCLQKRHKHTRNYFLLHHFWVSPGLNGTTEVSRNRVLHGYLPSVAENADGGHMVS